MEIWVSVNFNCPTEDEAQWREIFKGLEQYEAGQPCRDVSNFLALRQKPKLKR